MKQNMYFRKGLIFNLENIWANNLKRMYLCTSLLDWFAYGLILYKLYAARVKVMQWMQNICDQISYMLYWILVEKINREI